VPNPATHRNRNCTQRPYGSESIPAHPRSDPAATLQEIIEQAHDNAATRDPAVIDGLDDEQLALGEQVAREFAAIGLLKLATLDGQDPVSAYQATIEALRQASEQIAKGG
jgi:hypothetical protein